MINRNTCVCFLARLIIQSTVFWFSNFVDLQVKAQIQYFDRTVSESLPVKIKLNDIVYCVVLMEASVRNSIHTEALYSTFYFFVF